MFLCFFLKLFFSFSFVCFIVEIPNVSQNGYIYSGGVCWRQRNSKYYWATVKVLKHQVALLWIFQYLLYI